MSPLNVSKLYSSELDGIDAKLIEVEADINVGLHSFNIVGLGDKAINEAKERVNSALKNSGIKPPTKENRRITVNLAPADIKKTGSRLDLPIALSYLIASKQIRRFETNNSIFVGELSLNGSVRGVGGCLNVAILAKNKNINTIFVPKQNAAEAAVFSSVKVVPVSSLVELINHIEGRAIIPYQKVTPIEGQNNASKILMSDVKGNEHAKRALVIAAAGGHNILLSGPPGTGKTMLARAFASILPKPSKDEIIEITQIYSAVGLNKNNSFVTQRPFRSPHHTSSAVALMGGGPTPKPGEISLAHRGVLFLDEMPEFRRDVLEGLRQPLENGSINISRAKKTLAFPASFILIGAMNPCPCGYFEDPERTCLCTANEILKYKKKISGPLLDRIDIQLEIPRISVEKLRDKNSAENDNLRFIKLVSDARQVQKIRFENNRKTKTNSEMSSKEAEKTAMLDKNGENFLKKIVEKNFISPRGYYRMLKIARTIADVEKSENVLEKHLMEAFQYRTKINE